MLVGYSGIEHIGRHLAQAADQIGLPLQFADAQEAFRAPLFIQKLNWWLRGHLPTRLKLFSDELVRSCQKFRPTYLITTGISPVSERALERIGKLGILRINYLTDNPFNSVHRAPWFVKSLPYYDQVFSVRRSNLERLNQAGCRRIAYLPFAYAPELHYPEKPSTTEEKNQFESDVVFYGGADRDRIPYINALTKSGFKLALYGGYWGRCPETRGHTKGPADPRTLRFAVGCSRIALCLVRRANQDGNSMRTFEIPAMGGCLLAEDTKEHREIFGEEGKVVVYFQSVQEMVDKVRWLLGHHQKRQALAQAAHELIINGHHTYRDRLMAILDPFHE